MREEKIIDTTNYSDWVAELKKRYLTQQLKAAVQVNQELLRFYWSMGKDIVERNFANIYGSGFFQKLSGDLQKQLPEAKVFSPNNLRYMRSFYLLYCNTLQNLPQAVGDFKLSRLLSIPWGHHRYIMDRCHDDSNRAWFYVEKTLENNWSRAVLLNFLDTNLYEREGKAISNFKATLPIPHGELAQQVTKDPYNFSFLTLSEPYIEKELKDALTDNILKFLLELGNGFAFVGREYRLNVGNTEQYLDMLFYNIRLRCYVVIEVKTTPFTPGDLGQLGTYVVAINRQLKQQDENPTIGLLVCKNKDNILAQYALEANNLPMAVSEYELSKLYPVDFKSSLPSIDEIERELNNSIRH